MLEARIRHGRIEPQNPVPEDWEGQLVKVTPFTPADPLPDLEERLAALQALGPAEFEPEERERMEEMFDQLNRLSVEAMQQLAGGKP